MSKSKPHNGGTWTGARKNSFITSGLRQTSTRWPPKNECIKRARIRRGVYKCESCGAEGPATLPPKEGNKRRRKNIIADHIDPIVDPAVGFVDWNTWVDRCFVEADKYQAICYKCHTEKTNKERAIAKARRANK